MGVSMRSRRDLITAFEGAAIQSLARHTRFGVTERDTYLVSPVVGHEIHDAVFIDVLFSD